MTFGTAGVLGTAVVCGLGVAGVVGAIGVGCAGLCRLGRCRLQHRDMGSGRSLQCGCCGIWNGVSGLDTAFT